MMHKQHQALTGARRASIIAAIVFLGIAAVIGIIALFTGEWSDLHSKIMGTTLLAAAFSVILLVHLSIYDRTPQILFWLPMLLGFIGLVSSLFMVWYEWDWERIWGSPGDPVMLSLYESIWKIIWLSWLFTAFFTHANLMLLVRDNPKRAVQVVLWLTLALSATLTILTTILILTNGDFWFEYLDRIMGALLILWALGTIVLPILGRVLGKTDSTPSDVVQVTLPRALVNQLEQRATARGQNLVDYLGNFLE